MTDDMPTNSEAERLYILAEECGEVIQAITKILRHGWTSSNPKDSDAKQNYMQLEDEIEDVLATIKAMRDEGDICITIVDDVWLDNIWKNKLKYTHFQ